MPRVDAVPRENAAPELAELYAKMEKRFGHMPAFYGVMAHRPAVLQKFVELYGAIVGRGTVEAKYKELAYLKTLHVNGCEY